MSAELTVECTALQIAEYAAASGDHNPIHLDDGFARAAGLPGIIAHGMLQMGLAARVAAEAAGGAQHLGRMSCRFAAMVRPGDRVTYRAQVDGAAIRITAVNQDGVAVLTRATAEIAGG